MPGMRKFILLFARIYRHSTLRDSLTAKPQLVQQTARKMLRTTFRDKTHCYFFFFFSSLFFFNRTRAVSRGERYRENYILMVLDATKTQYRGNRIITPHHTCTYTHTYTQTPDDTIPSVRSFKFKRGHSGAGNHN